MSDSSDHDCRGIDLGSDAAESVADSDAGILVEDLVDLGAGGIRIQIRI